MKEHSKRTLANEYCLCREIPHRWTPSNQLVIGNKATGYDCIYCIDNIPYSEIVSTIDSMCEYGLTYGIFLGLKGRH